MDTVKLCIFTLAHHIGAVSVIADAAKSPHTAFSNMMLVINSRICRSAAKCETNNSVRPANHTYNKIDGFNKRHLASVIKIMHNALASL